MSRLLAAVLLLAVGVTLADAARAQAPAQGPALPTNVDDLLARSRDVMADGMVGSGIVHALYAETARALIDSFAIESGLPAARAVDELAAWLMLPEDRADPRFVRLAEAVQVWQLLERGAAAAGAPMPYWAARGFDRARYESTMCVVWGRGPGVYRTLARRAGLPADAQARCVETYQQVDARWLRLLEPHAAPDDAMRPGRMAMTVDWQVLALGGPVRALRESAMLEMVADQITASFNLTAELTLRVEPCAEPTIGWRPDERAIVLCEGLVAAIDRLIRPAFVNP